MTIFSSRNTWERITAIVLILLAGAMLIASVGYGLFEKGQPGPGLFPGAVACGLLVLSVLWLISGAGREAEPPAPGSLAAAVAEDEDAPDESTEIDKRGMKIIAFTVIWALVPILLLDRIGFVLTMTVYVGGMLIVIARMRWWLTLLISLVVSFGVAVGAHVASIVLPDPLSLLSLVGM